MHTATIESPTADAALIDLGKRLEAVQAEREALDPADESVDAEARLDDVWGRHWELRAAIDTTPAQTAAGWRAKARAAELALKYDPDNECHVAGSYRSLSQAIVRHVLDGAVAKAIAPAAA